MVIKLLFRCCCRWRCRCLHCFYWHVFRLCGIYFKVIIINLAKSQELNERKARAWQEQESYQWLWWRCRWCLPLLLLSLQNQFLEHFVSSLSATGFSFFPLSFSVYFIFFLLLCCWCSASASGVTVIVVTVLLLLLLLLFHSTNVTDQWERECVRMHLNII